MADEDQLVAPPVANPQTPAPVTAPGTTGVAAPTDPFADFRRQSAENAQRFSAMYATPAQQRAVQAATRFMAQQGYNRKYQQDIQAGMSPQEAAADALAEYGPSLFFQPGAAVTPGNVASFIRAVRPQPVKAPTANPIDVTEARGIIGEMGKIQSALDDNPTGPIADDNRGKLQYLRGQLEAIRAKYNTNATAPAPQQPQTRTAVSAPGVPADSGQASPNTGRVLVRRKDGKIGMVPARRLQEYLKAGYTQVSNANP